MTALLCHPQHLASASGPRAAATLVTTVQPAQVGKRNSRHASEALTPQVTHMLLLTSHWLQLSYVTTASAREAGKCNLGNHVLVPQ